jgi:DNA-binding MarR family transcriptional regulator
MSEEFVRQKHEELREMFLKVARENNFVLTNSPLSRQQILLLFTLNMHEKMTISELAGELSLSTSATTLAVNRLLRGHYIERMKDERDRRLVWIKITEYGRESMLEIKAHRDAIAINYLKKLTEDEIVHLTELFRKMLF